MTSSVLSGERRWASSRRSGMTVLGKVAVPKPINLPSQRLENHGLDPNVEIVPKGTLSWGSKSSSSSNAWGSSTLSPNTGGGSGSPSHLSALPLSGGSGSRPSTAGGGRAHEAANARGSNSRPSSASGTLASNQTSIASLHPQSAETGPGSSQLSRFCEAVSENSGAWSVVGTAEKLGMTSSKNDGFSFTSGDFPTLGSENDTSVKNERGSQGRPGSSSGVAPMKEMTGTSIVADISVNASLKSVNAISWRRDNPPYTEDGVQPSMEKWLADPQGSHPYPNSGIPVQHYDAWCGPPINNHPGGVWYRGPPAGPPYGPPVAPGGFPLEPFPYFRPQIPGSALANPRPGPPLGAGPRGSHPKNGDVYIGPMPDAFVRPGMPIRPAFYPRPVPMAYEGYYGPPMGYCNSNEQDIPFMGMPAGVSAQNWYPVQNAPDPCGSHAPRPTGYGPLGKALAAKHLESGHPHDTRGPCNQHDGWEGKGEEYRSEDNETVSAKKTEQKRTSSWENDCKADQTKVEEVNIGTVVDEASIQVIDYHGNDSILGRVKSSEGMENAEAYGYIAAEKMDHQEVPAATKNSSLILKIEGLNAKARASDEQCETISFCSKEEQKNKSQVVNAKAKHFANEVATGSCAVFPDGVPASGMIGPTSNEMVVSAGDKSLDLPDVAGAGANRRSTHNMHIRTDLRGRGSFNSQNADGWRKKPPFTDLPNVKSTMHSENPSDANVQDYMLLEVSETPGSYPQARDKGESMLSVHDPSDRQAQQCVKQQQKEEEQARGKKYKAFAKLEELNRRTKTAEGLTQKLESIPNSTVQHKREEFQTLTEEIIPSSRSEVTSLISNPTVIADAGQSSTGELEKPAILSNQQPLVPKKNFNKATADTHYHSLPLQQRVNNADGALYNYLQASVGSTSKQKHMGYKKKDYNSLDKSSSENYISARATELPNIPTDAAVDVALSAGAVINEITSKSKSICEQNVVNEPLMHQKRKNNRSGKNKHKVEEASSMAPLPFGISKETNLTISVDGSKPKSSECESDRSSFQSLTDSKDGNQSSVQDSAFPNEEGRVNNRWKSQHSQRMPRNPQAHRSAVHSGDAVAWAPVQSNNKAEATEGVSHESVVETVVPQSKNDAPLQNNPRNKRAEMGRYIPKPVAKEMAQQVITQQPVSPSDNQTAADEIMGRADSRSHGVECSQPVGTAMGKVGNTTELTNDGRQSRQGRGHRSWRQQASAEPTLQGLQDGDYFNPSQNAQKSIGQNQHLKPDLCLVKEHPKYDELNTSDGLGIPENPDSTVPQVFPVVRDQGMTGRGKRHAYKEHKGGGNNYNVDPKKFNNCEAGKLNLQSSVTEMVQRDSPAGSKVNLGAGDRSTSHWQPKSSAINQRGSRPDSDQNVGAEIVRTNSKDSVPQGMVSYPSHPDKESGEGMTQPPKDQYNSEKGSAEEAHNVGYLDSKRERNVASLKGRPHSPNQGPGLPVEAPSLYVDSRNEQRSMTGFHKNGNQSNRFGRGHFRGDWGSPGQEMKKHNAPTNHERQRHYEYQPVGPQNNSRTNPDGPKDGSFGSGASFSERSRSHSRHGSVNFHGRQSSSVKE